MAGKMDSKDKGLRLKRNRKVLKAFIWGAGLPMVLLLMPEPSLLRFFLLPFLFGFAFLTVNRDIPDPMGHKWAIAMLQFPLGYFLTVGVAFLMGIAFGQGIYLSENPGIAVLLLIAGSLASLPAIAVNWRYLSKKFAFSGQARHNWNPVLISAAIFGVCTSLSYIVFHLFAETLDEQALENLVGIGGHALLFACINARYRYLLNHFLKQPDPK